MAGILTDLNRTVIAGLILTAVLFIIYYVTEDYSGALFGVFFFRWLHVLSGVMWIGLLWYFNFVQIPNMPKIPDEQKPAIGKVIAPAALWWFRWGAMATIVTGLILGIEKLKRICSPFRTSATCSAGATKPAFSTRTLYFLG